MEEDPNQIEDSLDGDGEHDDGHVNKKAKRARNVCVRCRSRKQRCDGVQIPCQRCREAGKACSFETDPHALLRLPARDATEPSSPAGPVPYSIQQELQDHRLRIQALEAAMGLVAHQQRIQPVPSGSGASSPVMTPSSVSAGSFAPAVKQPVSNLDAIRLGPPIQTLRNLNVSTSSQSDSPSGTPSSNPSFRPPDRAGLDPVWTGTITVQDAQAFFDIYYQHCHSMAPFMCVETQSSPGHVRSASLFLFTCLCVVGARHWIDPAYPGSETRLHPRYFDLVALFDRQIASLVLHPSPADICLETVQGLLLSAQWLAIDRPAPPTARPQSRFNDASVWNMVGLAIRFAAFLQLERDIEKPFVGQGATDQEIRRMRVWLNLISVDHHLRLTASLPASLDPTIAARVVRVYASHPRAQPLDIKFAGLCELVMIAHRAATYSGDASLRSVDVLSLRKANDELNQWEGVWSAVLAGTIEGFQTQMPFTALRWYRLAINSIALQGPWSQRLPESVPIPPALVTSIDAAADLIFHFSDEAVRYPGLLYELPSYAPLTLSRPVAGSFRFSIDSYFVTATFAAVYLVLAYDRGAIDYNLRIREWSSPASPPPPPEHSIIFRLLRLSSDLFSSVCARSPDHPAGHYHDIVGSVFEALMRPTSDGHDVQEIFSTLIGEGFDWSMGIFPGGM